MSFFSFLFPLVFNYFMRVINAQMSKYFETKDKKKEREKDRKWKREREGQEVEEREKRGKRASEFFQSIIHSFFFCFSNLMIFKLFHLLFLSFALTLLPLSSFLSLTLSPSSFLSFSLKVFHSLKLITL